MHGANRIVSCRRVGGDGDGPAISGLQCEALRRSGNVAHYPVEIVDVGQLAARKVCRAGRCLQNGGGEDLCGGQIDCGNRLAARSDRAWDIHFQGQAQLLTTGDCERKRARTGGRGAGGTRHL